MQTESKKKLKVANVAEVIKIAGARNLDDYYYGDGGLINDKGVLDERLTNPLIKLYKYHVLAWENTTGWGKCTDDFVERQRLDTIVDMMEAAIMYFASKEGYTNRHISTAISLASQLPLIFRVLHKYSLNDKTVNISEADGRALLSALVSMNVWETKHATKPRMISDVLKAAVRDIDTHDKYAAYAMAGMMYYPLLELIEAKQACGLDGENRMDEIRKEQKTN